MYYIIYVLYIYGTYMDEHKILPASTPSKNAMQCAAAAPGVRNARQRRPAVVGTRLTRLRLACGNPQNLPIKSH